MVSHLQGTMYSQQEAACHRSGMAWFAFSSKLQFAASVSAHTLVTYIKRLMYAHSRGVFPKLWRNTVLGLFFLLSDHQRSEVNDRSSLCQTRPLVFFSWLTAGTRRWLAPFTNRSCDTAGAYVGLTGCVCLLWWDRWVDDFQVCFSNIIFIDIIALGLLHLLKYTTVGFFNWHLE